MVVGTSATYGKRLLPPLITFYAKTDPTKVYASIPRCNEDLSQGFRDITYVTFANAINRAAWWLEQHLGKSNGEFETFAYLGPRDLRYPILAVAAIKVGRKGLMPSLLASLEAQTHLAKTTNTRTFLCAKPLISLTERLHKELLGTNIIVVPELEDWLSEEEVFEYEYSKTWEEAREDPFVVYHTSGSSGIPKTVTITNEMIATIDGHHLLPLVDGIAPNTAVFENKRIYGMLPIFHIVGCLVALSWAPFYSMTLVLGPPDIPVTAPIANAVHSFGNVDGGFYSPGLLEELFANSAYRENMANLELIGFGGAPLAKIAGDWLAKVGNLRPIIGSTEGGVWATVPTVNFVPHGQNTKQTEGNGGDPEDWNYFRFHPYFGAHFELVTSNPDMYELVIRRTPESYTHTNFFKIKELPNLTEFRSKDLWSPHPDPRKHEKGLWKYRGRTDDLILLTGEVKMYSASAEEHLRASHAGIKAALIGGAGKSRPFLLLELAYPEDAHVLQNGLKEGEDVVGINGQKKADADHDIEEIWPVIEEANEHLAVETRLLKDLVLVASKEKPFVRLGKGSVDRRSTFRLYEKEIERMYARSGIL